MNTVRNYYVSLFDAVIIAQLLLIGKHHMLHKTPVTCNAVNILIQGPVHKSNVLGREVSGGGGLQCLADQSGLYFTNHPCTSN